MRKWLACLLVSTCLTASAFELPTTKQDIIKNPDTFVKYDKEVYEL